jgi:hypothetical protein
LASSGWSNDLLYESSLAGELLFETKQPSSQLETLKEKYYEIQHEGPDGRQVSPGKGQAQGDGRGTER